MKGVFWNLFDRVFSVGKKNKMSMKQDAENKVTKEEKPKKWENLQKVEVEKKEIEKAKIEKAESEKTEPEKNEAAIVNWVLNNEKSCSL